MKLFHYFSVLMMITRTFSWWLSSHVHNRNPITSSTQREGVTIIFVERRNAAQFVETIAKNLLQHNQARCSVSSRSE